MGDKYLGDNLIFIISQPRSGSTLLQRVLAGNSAITASSEPWVMLHPAYGLREHGIWTNYGVDWAAHGVTEFLDHYTDGREVYDDAIRAFARTLYSNALAKGGGHWFIDKTPRYILIVDDLIRLFPKAKFIFLLRNPLSVLASILNTQIGHDLTTLERFGCELIIGPRAILKGMSLLGDAATVVRYEDFVQAPERHTKEICRTLGIEFEDGMVDYSGTEPVKGFMRDRTGIEQHSRPSDTRISSWQQLLEDAQQLHFAESYLHELGRDTFEQLGYPWDDLMQAVEAARPAAKGSVTLPWYSALAAPGDSMGLDHFHVDMYRNIRDHGRIIGYLLTIKSFFKAFTRQMRWVFGRSKFFRQ